MGRGLVGTGRAGAPAGRCGAVGEGRGGEGEEGSGGEAGGDWPAVKARATPGNPASIYIYIYL